MKSRCKEILSVCPSRVSVGLIRVLYLLFQLGVLRCVELPRRSEVANFCTDENFPKTKTLHRAKLPRNREANAYNNRRIRFWMGEATG